MTLPEALQRSGKRFRSSPPFNSFNGACSAKKRHSGASFTGEVRTCVQPIRRRLEEGDKLTVGAFTLESNSRGAAVQSVVSSDIAQTQSKGILTALNTDAHGKVLIATSAGFRGDPSGLVGAGDVLGMAALQAAFLATPTVKVETAIIRTSSADLSEMVRQNKVFISVGGPYGNLLTRFVMSQTYTAFWFDGLSIVDRRDGKKYVPTIGSEVAFEDYLKPFRLEHGLWPTSIEHIGDVGAFMKWGTDGYNLGIRVGVGWWDKMKISCPTVLKEDFDHLCGRVDLTLAILPYKEFRMYWNPIEWKDKYSDQLWAAIKEARNKYQWTENKGSSELTAFEPKTISHKYYDVLHNTI